MHFPTPAQLLFLCCLLFSLTSQAQVGITTADFPRSIGFTDSIFRAPVPNYTSPAEGSDQVWNYSELTTDSLLLTTYLDAQGETAFPGATNKRTSDLSFQGFPIESELYEGIDENGWYELGRTLQDVSYSITALTGGPTDTLRFLPANEIFEGRINYVEFPMAYENEWMGTEIRREGFELSLAAFGLNKTPGFRQRIYTEARSIVGYGMITLPPVEGETLQPVRALLLKSVETIIDSTFLGGAPAPASLMAAFGLAQGAITVDSFYVFYTPGLGAPLLSWNNDLDLAFFRVQPAREPATGTRNQGPPSAMVYPNPVIAGQQLIFRTEHPIPAGEVVLLNTVGHEVSRAALRSGVEFSLRIPAHCPAGFYVYQVRSQAGGIMYAGKLRVE